MYSLLLTFVAMRELTELITERGFVLWNSAGKFPNPKCCLRGRSTKLRKLSMTLCYTENVSFKIQSHPQTHFCVPCCSLQLLLQEWIALGFLQLLLTWAAPAPPKGTQSWAGTGSDGHLAATKRSLSKERMYKPLLCPSAIAGSTLLGECIYPHWKHQQQSLGLHRLNRQICMPAIKVYSGTSLYMQLGFLSNVFFNNC